MQNSETVLVTGGTGFLAAHIIIQLLEKGYAVRTTLRSLKRKDEATEMLKAGGATSFANLSFAEADLTKDDGWQEAMRGCSYVISVASPLFFTKDKAEAEMVRLVADGALRVLHAARAAGVKRVVTTSSFGAVGFSRKDGGTTTEEDWTSPDEAGLSGYEKSKVLSERAAWDFISREGGGLELSVINPVAILGPALRRDVTGSFELLKHLLDGSMKAAPAIPLNIVDVRDVADLHIRAMTEPKAAGQRFLASAPGKVSMPEIAALLKERVPDVAQKVPAKALPDWVLKFAGLFNHQAKLAVPLLRINRNLSSAKAKALLGWEPKFSTEDAILAAVESMKKLGAIS